MLIRGGEFMPCIKNCNCPSTFQSTMSAFDSISSEQAASEEEHMKDIGQYCPASCLVESPLEIQGVTYAIDGSELFLAMNGREFEV
jgi:hypothetical protein